MIRKLQRWFLSLLGPAVRVKYLPGSGTWRVEVRYMSFGCWHPSSRMLHPLKSHGWTMDRNGYFANLNDAMACAKLVTQSQRIADLDDRKARIISFFGQQVKW